MYFYDNTPCSSKLSNMGAITNPENPPDTRLALLAALKAELTCALRRNEYGEVGNMTIIMFWISVCSREHLEKALQSAEYEEYGDLTQSLKGVYLEIFGESPRAELHQNDSNT